MKLYSRTPTEHNPILHGGGGGQKVVALISIVENLGEILAIVMKLVAFPEMYCRLLYFGQKK